MLHLYWINCKKGRLAENNSNFFSLNLNPGTYYVHRAYLLCTVLYPDSFQHCAILGNVCLFG